MFFLQIGHGARGPGAALLWDTTRWAAGRTPTDIQDAWLDEAARRHRRGPLLLIDGGRAPSRRTARGCGG